MHSLVIIIGELVTVVVQWSGELVTVVVHWSLCVMTVGNGTSSIGVITFIYAVIIHVKVISLCNDFKWYHAMYCLLVTVSVCVITITDNSAFNRIRFIKHV